MKSRFELFSVFQKFIAEIKTQFGVSICALSSDNAPEYFSSQFTTFMTANGILHQSSYPYTPKQNDVIERKNYYLIETARTLLLHANLPTKFWGDVVLIACYLINACHLLPCYRTKFLILFCSLHNHFIMFPFVYLNVSILCILSHLDKINLLSRKAKSFTLLS